MAEYDFSNLMEEEQPTGKYDFTGLMDEKPDREKAEKKKKAWEIQTSKELQEQGFSPTAAGLIQTGQQLSSPLWKYGNMLLGGLPNVALEKMGYEAPTVGKGIVGGLETAANIVGFVRGLPMKLGGVAARALPQASRAAGVVSNIARGALGGATQLGTASALHTPEGQFENWRARLARGGLGAAVGTVTGGIGGAIDHFKNILSQSSQLKTGESVRQGFRGFKNRLTNWFGEKLNKFQKAKPNAKVNLSKPLDKFKKGLDDNKRFKTLLRTSPRLQKAMKKKKLTLKETQDLVNQLKETISQNKLAKYDLAPSKGEINNFINSIQKTKHSVFPEMKWTDKTYGKMTTYADAVSNYMQYGKTVKGLRLLVKNPETRKSLQKILPDDLFKTVSQTVKAQKITKEGFRAIDYLVRYGILYKFLKETMDNAGSRELVIED